MQNNSIGLDAMFQGLVNRGYSPAVVYDIGASDGGWTKWASQYWPSAKFVCFEPLEERKAALEMLAKENSRVQCVFTGLAEVDEVRSLGVGLDLYTSSFAYGSELARQVDVKRLDGLIESGEIPKPNFMKLDVQGYEKLVLSGGQNATAEADLILMECAFFPFCEAMSTLDESISFMSQNGFIPYEFVDWLRRPLDGAMGQCDLLFVRRDHSLVSNKSWG